MPTSMEFPVLSNNDFEAINELVINLSSVGYNTSAVFDDDVARLVIKTSTYNVERFINEQENFKGYWEKHKHDVKYTLRS